jgi:hypothetical protein
MLGQVKMLRCKMLSQVMAFKDTLGHVMTGDALLDRVMTGDSI